MEEDEGMDGEDSRREKFVITWIVNKSSAQYVF